MNFSCLYFSFVPKTKLKAFIFPHTFVVPLSLHSIIISRLQSSKIAFDFFSLSLLNNFLCFKRHMWHVFFLHYRSSFLRFSPKPFTFLKRKKQFRKQLLRMAFKCFGFQFISSLLSSTKLHKSAKPQKFVHSHAHESA